MLKKIDQKSTYLQNISASDIDIQFSPTIICANNQVYGKTRTIIFEIYDAGILTTPGDQIKNIVYN